MSHITIRRTQQASPCNANRQCRLPLLRRVPLHWLEIKPRELRPPRAGTDRVHSPGVLSLRSRHGFRSVGQVFILLERALDKSQLLASKMMEYSLGYMDLQSLLPAMRGFHVSARSRRVGEARSRTLTLRCWGRLPWRTFVLRVCWGTVLSTEAILRT